MDIKVIDFLNLVDAIVRCRRMIERPVVIGFTDVLPKAFEKKKVRIVTRPWRILFIEDKVVLLSIQKPWYSRFCDFEVAKNHFSTKRRKVNDEIWLQLATLCDDDNSVVN